MDLRNSSQVTVKEFWRVQIARTPFFLLLPTGIGAPTPGRAASLQIADGNRQRLRKGPSFSSPVRDLEGSLFEGLATIDGAGSFMILVVISLLSTRLPLICSGFYIEMAFEDRLLAVFCLPFTPLECSPLAGTDTHVCDWN